MINELKDQISTYITENNNLNKSIEKYHELK